MGIQITITVDDNGQCNVTGPIDNKVLFYGVVELAKDAVREHIEQSKRLVQPAQVVMPGNPFVKS